MKPATVQEEFIPFQAADEHLFSISGYCFVVRGPVGAVQGSVDNVESSGEAVLLFRGKNKRGRKK